MRMSALLATVTLAAGVHLVLYTATSLRVVDVDPDMPVASVALVERHLHASAAGLEHEVIVVDDATCMVRQTLKFSNFFKGESCGQCPPCRMGTINLATLMAKIEAGEGTQKDLDSLLQLCGFVKGTGYCTIVTGASVLVQSSVKLFRHEFEDHIRLQRCPYPATASAEAVTH